MKTTRTFRSRKSMQGLSLIELMIAMTLGLVVLGALVSVFANTSASRQELERTSRQIENGRFAMEILADDIRHAGFYGEANVKGLPPEGSLLNLNGTAAHLCENLADKFITAMPIHVQGFDEGQWAPWCFAGPIVPRTDIIVIRRVATCEAGVGDCPAPKAEHAYMQVSKCATETATRAYMFGVYGSTTFNLTERDCATPAKLRKYILRMYYISPDNGRGEAIPTLKRVEWAGTTMEVTPVVEGIEDMQFEYGLDSTGPGMPNARPDPLGVPDIFTADPNTYRGCNPGSISDTTQTKCIEQNWASVISVNVHLLARSIESSPGYTNPKSYNMGVDMGGSPIVRTPNDHYRRHAFTAMVRVVNPSGRRDVP